MTYDPFARGPHPVGVTTRTWRDVDRDRDLVVEIWYPATAAYAGLDLDPATCDSFVPDWAAAEGIDEVAIQQAVRDAAWAELPEAPLVLLIHGWAGFRREATFVGTHLASHGYVVVSPDVPGSTWTDVDAFLLSQEPVGDPVALAEHVRGIADERAADIPFLIDQAVATLPVRARDVGVTGASFGGFSSVIAPAYDQRVAAIVPMCPANTDSPAAGGHPSIDAHVNAAWMRDAATLILAADRDSLLPLYGQLTLLSRLPARNKRLVALAHTDHNHFVDDIEVGQQWLAEFAARIARLFPEGPGDWTLVARSVQPMDRLLPAEPTKTGWRGLVTAHFDAHLRDLATAAEALDDIDGLLADRGVASTTFGHVHA